MVRCIFHLPYLDDPVVSIIPLVNTDRIYDQHVNAVEMSVVVSFRRQKNVFIMIL